MKLRYSLCIWLMALLCSAAHAQGVLKGRVEETGTNTRLSEVFITNQSNKEVSLTDANGNFEIRANTGNLLIFSAPGYVSDTLFLINTLSRTIKLTPKSISLREVNIRSSRAFNPRAEYPQVYERSKVYVLSPTSWFSKSAKDARRLKRYFAREVEERHVDSIFTSGYVASIVPLKGQELEDFMTLYRPSYAFLQNNNGPSLAAYINDSYKKFMSLPPEKRKVQHLHAEPQP